MNTISKYWVKDATRKEIITKTQIPNNRDFRLFANYFNLMDKQGLSFPLNEATEIQTDKLFTKNGFEYLILNLNNINEFLVLPNENLLDYTEKVVAQIDSCQKEKDVLNLLIETM